MTYAEHVDVKVTNVRQILRYFDSTLVDLQRVKLGFAISDRAISRVPLDAG